MKKRMTWLVVFAMLLSLTACGSPAPKGDITNDVTWEELLAANRLEAVFTQVDSFSSATDDNSDGTYVHYAAMVDGQLMYSTGSPGYTEDMRNGIIYDAPEDAMEHSITILAPTADFYKLVEGAYGEELSEYELAGDIYEKDGQYFAAIYHEDEEWGIVTEGYAYFDIQTLLLERVEMKQKLGAFEVELTGSMTYQTGSDFAMSSYDNIVNTDNPVNLTIHYPDGTTQDITVDRDVTVLAYYPGHQETWSVCWDAACTGSVDNLDWIEGSHGDLYLCEGYVEDIPPILSRVLEKSTFETMFRENYDTYFQTAEILDAEQNLIEVKELAWYVDEEAGLCLNFEVKDADYNVTQSGRARDGAWYSWSAEQGYAVDFYDDFRYAENLIKKDRLLLHEEQLGAPMILGDGGYAYYIPFEKTVGGGMTNYYRYWIHPDFDNIDRVDITHKDSAQNIVGYTMYYIGGNGPIPGELDIYTAIAAPEDVDTVALIVNTVNGAKTYTVRSDAAIFWKGGALYSDEACTQAVTDLFWADGSKANVYVK